MELLAYVVLYFVIGVVLEWSLSEKFEIWPVLIWPLMLIACFVLLIVQLIERRGK